MADQVETLLGEKHQLQEQIISLQRDNAYLQERTEYLQKQTLDSNRSSSGNLDEDAVSRIQHELDLQRVVNAQLQREIEHLRHRIIVEKSPVSPLLSLMARAASKEETSPPNVIPVQQKQHQQYQQPSPLPSSLENVTPEKK